MTMMETPDQPPKAPEVNKNSFKWSGYFNTPEQAEDSLKEKTKHIAEIENKLIISSKKELLNRKCHGLFLYRFTVITTDKK